MQIGNTFPFAMVRPYYGKNRAVYNTPSNEAFNVILINYVDDDDMP